MKPKDVSDSPIKSVIHNFSSYILSKEEEIALSYELKNPVPHRLNRNGIMTEFEYFYQQISYHTTHLSYNEQEELKSKVRRICENYMKIRIRYKYKIVIQNLSQNKNIVLLNQDKGQGIVILDRTKYIEKCMNLINTDQFRELENDPTKRTETKLQNILRSLKNNQYLSEEDYKRIYPKSSRPGLFYGTAKLHKLKEIDTVESLPLRPIISNIGTATYKTAKYLATLPSPVTSSEYNIKNSHEFAKSIKNTKIPSGYKMISFDVKNLSTNVPLHKTIKIILRKIYQEIILDTYIPQKEMEKTTHKVNCRLVVVHINFRVKRIFLNFRVEIFYCSAIIFVTMA